LNSTLNILFICSSLEPGKDGVGDYTRKLACALINKGYNTGIIALNDRRMDGNMWRGQQISDNTAVNVLRLSESFSWDKRLTIAKKLLADFKPDWISLQYVPFGFNLKGLPFNLAKKLKQLAGNNRWEVMFHELAVNRDESFKFKIWSLLQVKIIRDLLAKLQPLVIHTNTELYKYRIKEMGFEATVLPLFSNISNTTKNEEEIFNANIPTFISAHRDDYIVGTLFGSFDFKRWNMRSLLNKFTYKFSKKRIAIVSLGRMPTGQDYWELLKKNYPQVDFISLGEQSAEFISYWLLNYTDFGILTTLPELSGKSGSFMAFKEHGVPVVCTKESTALKPFQILLDKVLTVVDDKTNFELPPKYQPVSLLNNVVEQFINDLKNNSHKAAQ